LLLPLHMHGHMSGLLASWLSAVSSSKHILQAQQQTTLGFSKFDAVADICMKGTA
jgi:hypothetical protein